MNEVHWIGDGAKRTLVLGLVPKISIDVRIRCPRTFTSEFPPPPPPTPREVVVDTYFGDEIVDPYRWLEDATSARVAEWTEAQNARLIAALEALLPDAKDPWSMRARALLARIKA